MWSEAPVIFEDEDEEKLKADFVRLWAAYPDRDPTEISRYLFKNLRDNILRGPQAGRCWAEDLEILERVKAARLNGGVEPTPVESREQKLRKLEAIFNDTNNSAAVRIKAIELHSQIQGEIVKPSEKDGTNERPRFHPPILARYPKDEG